MTITEAAACGTPAVATRIAGHEDAIVDGVSGTLADTMEDVVTAAGAVLADDELRARISRGAIETSRRFSWDATALQAFRALTDQTQGRAGRGD